MTCGAKAKSEMWTASPPGAASGVAGRGVPVGRGVGASVGRVVAEAARDDIEGWADACGAPVVAGTPEAARLGAAVAAPTLDVEPAGAAGGGVRLELVGLHAVTRTATIGPITHRPPRPIAGYARRLRRDRTRTATIVGAAVADGLLVATARTADATCQTPPNAAIPSP